MRACTLMFLNVMQAHAAIPVSDTEQNFFLKRKRLYARSESTPTSNSPASLKTLRFRECTKLFIAARLFFKGWILYAEMFVHHS